MPDKILWRQPAYIDKLAIALNASGISQSWKVADEAALFGGRPSRTVTRPGILSECPTLLFTLIRQLRFGPPSASPIAHALAPEELARRTHPQIRMRA